MPIIRLLPGVLKTAEFIAALDSRPADMERLKKITKNETVRCYAQVNDAGYPSAYAVTSFTEGADSLLCNYFQELGSGKVTRQFLVDLLDHTGFEVMTVPAPSPEVVKILTIHGFTLAETVWQGDVSTYRNFPVSRDVENISGEAYYKLSKEDADRLREIMSDAYFGDLRTDPLKRRPGEGSFFQDVMERIADFRYETFIIRNPERKIVGYAQCHRLEPGTVVVQGVGVALEERGKRYGRKLIAAVLKHAAGLGPTVYATVFAENAASEHLFKNVLRFRQIMPVYGLSRHESEMDSKDEQKHRKGSPRPAQLIGRPTIQNYNKTR